MVIVPISSFVFEHRHTDAGARATERRCPADGFSGIVGRVTHLLRPHDAFEQAARRWLISAAGLEKFGKRRRHVVHCPHAHPSIFMEVQHAEGGFADAHRVLQHGLEHRLQFAGRACDDLQHLRGRGLLLQRLGELLFQVGVGCAKAVNISARLRSGRTKRGNACSALRPLARQGHLVGTVTGPLPVGPSRGSSPSILTEPHDEPALIRSPRRHERARSVGFRGQAPSRS